MDFFHKSTVSPLAALKHVRMYPLTGVCDTCFVPNSARYQQREAHSPPAVHWRDAARQARPSLRDSRKNSPGQEIAGNVGDTIDCDQELGVGNQRSAPLPAKPAVKADPPRQTQKKIAKETAEAKRLKRNRKATNSAMGMVGWRPHSEQELRQKLADKEHDADAIDEAVQKLQRLGMHSDREYAEIFAQSKWRQSRWAPTRIRRELASKGLAKTDIEAAIQDVFGNGLSLGLQDLGHDRTEVTTDTRFDPRHHLLEGVKCQVNLSRGLKPETRKRRLIMWLQRRGHDWETISTLLKHVDLT